MQASDYARKAKAQGECVAALVEANTKNLRGDALTALAIIGLRTKLSSVYNAAWWRTHGDEAIAARETEQACALLLKRKRL